MTNDSSRITVFQWVTGIVLPLATLAIGAIGTFAREPSPRLIALFLVATSAVSSLGLAPRIWRWVQRKWAERLQNQLAARELPQFRNCVSRFGDFANNRTNDTLHGIIRESRGLGSEVLTKHLQPHTIQLWDSLWTFFLMRINRQQVTLDELRASIQEFSNLVGQYYQACISPIFEYHSDEIRGVITPDEKAKLNRFCRDYQAFANVYIDFLRRLSQSHTSCANVNYYVAKPKEL